jgi:sirohydrochlorin cobaltochelatase
MTNDGDQPGILVVGHGTRSPKGTEQFFALVSQLAQRMAPVPVEAALLELQQPDIAAGIERLARQGVRGVTVLPLLLFAAGHARRDIPHVVAAAMARCNGQDIDAVQASHLGCHPAIVELSARRFNEAVAGRLPVPAGETCLLLVGRGSYDESATAAMQEFARLRQLALGDLHTEVAFLAMARPALTDILPRLAETSFRRIIVQPHLLFDGELVDSIDKQVGLAKHQRPHKDWIITPLLGDQPSEIGCGTELLLQAIIDRCQEAAIHVVAAAGDD